MKDYQIFISYRRDGGEMLGQLLHDRLTEKGYRVFFDVESLRSGKFNEELYRVMDKCRDVIVVLPPNALDRCKDEDDWVRKEIAFCISGKKNIIPVMMRNFSFPDTLPDDITEIRNYNGISASEIASFPWVLEQLTTKYLNSKPEKKAVQTTTEKKGVLHHFFNVIRYALGLSFIAFPYVSQYLKLDFSPLPDALENFLTVYAGYDLRIYTAILAVIFFAVYTFGAKGDFEYIRKKYKDRNIDEDSLNLSSGEFTTKLLSMENTASIIKNRDLSFEAPPVYSDYKSFNGMVYGSFDGSCVDYLYVDFEQLPRPEDLSILYLEKNTGKQRATKFLSKQGFVFLEENDDLLHFVKDDMHIRLAYTESGMHILGMEMSRSENISAIREQTLKAWEESFVKEAKKGVSSVAAWGKKLMCRAHDKFCSLKPSTQGLIVLCVLITLILIGVLFAVFGPDTESVTTLSEMEKKAAEYISGKK